MKNIETLIRACEIDTNDPTGRGRFEVLNMLTNRDVIEERKSKLTSSQAARLLFADEKLMSHHTQIISECGGQVEYVRLRQHAPKASAWWWFLEQMPVEQPS